jgi:hypothetical protein
MVEKLRDSCEGSTASQIGPVKVPTLGFAARQGDLDQAWVEYFRTRPLRDELEDDCGGEGGRRC